MSNINFLAEIDHLRDENEKLKQALEEVRDIASDALDIIVENDELLCYVGHIYNKINEALKDE